MRLQRWKLEMPCAVVRNRVKGDVEPQRLGRDEE